MRVAASRSTKALEALTRAHSALQSEIDLPHVAERRREAVFRDFVERVYTGYCGLMRTHTTRYRSLLNDVLAGVKL